MQKALTIYVEDNEVLSHINATFITESGRSRYVHMTNKSIEEKENAVFLKNIPAEDNVSFFEDTRK